MKKNFIVKTGTTRNAKYIPYNKAPSVQEYKQRYKNHGLNEDYIFLEISVFLKLKTETNKNTYSILNYAFTEMLNNAIDHSMSEYIDVKMAVLQNTAKFSIRDWGIGIYYSIKNKFNLQSETEAMIHLLKGKTTTMPDRHSGEGIFFTSKLCDTMVIRSHKLQLIIDNTVDDAFVSEKRNIKGTLIEFEIKRHSNRRIEAIFKKYSPEEYDYSFEKTTIKLKLVKPTYVSRSEAKRILMGLEKFREITMDFKGVENVGQGFIDEIFRVFKSKHPNIKIIPKNCNQAVLSMIKHTEVDN